MTFWQQINTLLTNPKTKIESENSTQAVLLIGLGNPGSRYANSRHNFGRLVALNFASKLNIDLKLDKKLNAQFGQGELKGQSISFLLPETFMNRSGDSLKAYLRFKPTPKNIIIVQDDLDLELGRLKLSRSFNSAGHNGLKSIFINLPDNIDMIRLRLGLNPQAEAPDFLKKLKEVKTKDFVLLPFDDSEQSQVDEVIDQASHLLEVLISDGYDQALISLNRKLT